MKTSNLFKVFALALTCAALAMTAAPAEARLVKAHAGTTFTLTPVEFDPSGNPTKFTHTVDGVVRVSSLGNCTVHFDVIGVPRPDGTFALTGSVQITSADGQTTLSAVVEGSTSSEPANALMANFHYEVAFTGGTGLMANARGKADIDGFALFNADFGSGKATWAMNGRVFTHRGGKGDW